MSRNEWERGEIVIPTAQWATFKRSVREAVNAHYTRCYQDAVKIYERLLAEGKGKRDFPYGRRAVDMLREHKTDWSSRDWFRPEVPAYRIGEWELLMALWPAADGNNYRCLEEVHKPPHKPARKGFQVYTIKDTAFAMGEGHLYFDEEKHQATWSVSENNHACDHARATALGLAFFNALQRVKWVRGSGGVIYGNDEYAEEAGHDFAGGGGSYTKDTFGPKGQQATEIIIRYPRRRRKP